MNTGLSLGRLEGTATSPVPWVAKLFVSRGLSAIQVRLFALDNPSREIHSVDGAD